MRQMALVRVTDRHGHISDRVAGIEQGSSALRPYHFQVHVRRKAYVLLERPRQVKWTETRDRAQLRQRDISGEAGIDVLTCVPDRGPFPPDRRAAETIVGVLHDQMDQGVSEECVSR